MKLRAAALSAAMPTIIGGMVDPGCLVAAAGCYEL
jgi:hypothetical protein